eukprot:6212896-Pleurochrysis_carterae.AAC.1
MVLLVREMVGIGTRHIGLVLGGGRSDGSQNFRHSASVTYSPIRHWESGDRVAPLIQHSPSIH